MTMTRNAEAYTTCADDHEHWGLAGAAGLLIFAEGRMLLQKRPPWAHHNDSWSTPGGALAFGEDPVAGAMREAAEEMGALPHLTYRALVVSDCGGWKYTTVLATAEAMFEPTGDDGHEHAGAGWFTPEELPALDLHPGFAAFWEQQLYAAAIWASHQPA